MSVAKFGIGDKVKVVNYGSQLISYRDGSWFVQDMLPEIVGKEGIIDHVSETQKDYIQYSIDGIPRKHAWYVEQQLEMVNKNPNR